MGRFNYIHNRFLLGECSPATLGSSDLKDSYFQMCQEITNGIVKKQGGMMRRPGTQFMTKTVGGGTAIPTASRLFPFVFSKHESYDVIITNDSTIGTKGITVRNCSTGAEATITNSLSASPYITFKGYDQYNGYTDLQVSQYSQNGDVLCIVNGSHPPIFIVRTGTDAFTLYDIWSARLVFPVKAQSAYTGSSTAVQEKLTPSSPPVAANVYYNIPYAAATPSTGYNVGQTVTPSATTGNITLTFSTGPVGNPGDILCIQGSGYVVLTGSNFVPTRNATVLKTLPGTSAYSFTTGTWGVQNEFGGNAGWPRTVCFYQQRVIYGGSLGFPDTLWGSQQGDFVEMMALRPSDDANFASLSNDRPFAFTIAQTEINDIQWLACDKDLYVGTGGKELIASGPDPSLSLGPLNVGFAEQTAYGSEFVQAKVSDGTVHFVQRGGLNLREMIYEFRENKRIANDLNKNADHIVKKGLTKRSSFAVPKVRELAYQALEHNITWCLDTNNCLFGLTRDRHEEVMGWHWHELGGVTNSTEISKVVSITSVPSPDGDGDELHLLVTRTINGGDVTYLEKMGKPYRFANVTNSSTDIKDKLVMSDCAVLQHLGSPGNTFNGFTHLKNMAVECFADGFYLGSITVDNTGTITLPGPTTYTNLVAGLKYNTRIRPFPVSAGAIMGSADSVPKRIDRTIIRFQDTIRALFGKTDDATLSAIEFRDRSLSNGTPTPMFTGVKNLMYQGPIEEDADILIKCDQALPMTVTSLTLRGVTYEG